MWDHEPRFPLIPAFILPHVGYIHRVHPIAYINRSDIFSTSSPMSDLQKSFAKAKLAKLPAEPPIPAMDPLEEDDSSGSSTGTVTPSPSKRLFARPDRECVYSYSRVTPQAYYVAYPSHRAPTINTCQFNTTQVSLTISRTNNAANLTYTDPPNQPSAGLSSSPRSSSSARNSTTPISRIMST